MEYQNIRNKPGSVNRILSFYVKGIIFSLALLSMAFITDLAYLWVNDPFWARLSIWMLAAGALMGSILVMLELIRGVGHGLLVQQPGRIEHFGLTLATALASINCLIRIQDLHNVLPWGLVLSIAAVTVLSVTTWLESYNDEEQAVSKLSGFPQHIDDQLPGEVRQ